MRFALLSLFIMFAGPVFAAGAEDDTPPEPTKTVTECTDGQIYDEESKACIDSEEQSFSDDERYDAVRELAYAGDFGRAATVIANADQPDDARFLNYRGFLARKQGRTVEAMAYYEAALTRDPNYHLARSYMGQGMVAMGDIAGAKAQLAEIASRGGRNTWAYASLKLAVGGKPSSY